MCKDPGVCRPGVHLGGPEEGQASGVCWGRLHRVQVTQSLPGAPWAGHPACPVPRAATASDGKPAFRTPLPCPQL